MIKSNLSLAYNLNLLEPKFKWIALVIWNGGLIVWIVGLNSSSSIGMILGNISATLTAAYLARCSFRLGTDSSYQSTLLNKDTSSSFNPSFFVNSGGLLCIFVFAFFWLSAFYTYQLLG